MEPIRFTVTWDETTYRRAYQKLYAPYMLRMNGLRGVIHTLALSVGVACLAAIQGFLFWVSYETWGWSLIVSLLFSVVFVSLAIFVGSFDSSRTVSSHMKVLLQLGSIEFEVSDAHLFARYRSGVEMRLPWSALKLIGENSEGLLLLLVDRNQPILIPRGAMQVGSQDASIAIRASLGSS